MVKLKKWDMILIFVQVRLHLVFIVGVDILLEVNLYSMRKFIFLDKAAATITAVLHQSTSSSVSHMTFRFSSLRLSLEHATFTACPKS